MHTKHFNDLHIRICTHVTTPQLTALILQYMYAYYMRTLHSVTQNYTVLCQSTHSLSGLCCPHDGTHTLVEKGSASLYSEAMPHK